MLGSVYWIGSAVSMTTISVLSSVAAATASSIGWNARSTMLALGGSVSGELIRSSTIALIKTTGRKLLSINACLRSSQMVGASEQLGDMDLSSQLDIVRALLQDIPDGGPLSVNIAVHHTYLWIEKIHQDVTVVESIVTTYNAKWFLWTREPPNVQDILINLNRCREKLKDSTNVLMKLLVVYGLVCQDKRFLPTTTSTKVVLDDPNRRTRCCMTEPVAIVPEPHPDKSRETYSTNHQLDGTKLPSAPKTPISAQLPS